MHIAVGTEYAAIAGVRSQQLPTISAVIKKLAGISRHALARRMPAMRAFNSRELDDFRHRHAAPASKADLQLLQ